MKQVNDAPVATAPPRVRAVLVPERMLAELHKRRMTFLELYQTRQGTPCPECFCEITFGIAVPCELEGYGLGESHFRSCGACGWKSRNVFVQDERFEPHEYTTLDAPTEPDAPAEPFSEN